MKCIRVGDVIYLPFVNETIEVIGILKKEGKLQYWSDGNPKQVGTRKCQGMAAFIAFKCGIKLTNVGDMRKVYSGF